MKPGWVARIPSWWAGFWGFAEGLFFFIVPDVLFTAATVESLKKGWMQLAAAIAGAVMAGALMYLWAAAAPAQARAAVAAVPFVGEKIITPAEQRWTAEGSMSLFKNPLSGVPYKVHAVLAPSHMPLAEFLMASLPLRAERMLLSMIVFVPLGLWIRLSAYRDIDWRRRIGSRLHLAFWTLVYTVYWSVNYS